MRNQPELSRMFNIAPGNISSQGSSGNDIANDARTEVARLQDRLASLSEKLGCSSGAGSGVEEGTRVAPVNEFEILIMLEWRQARATFFEPDLFADPAWDMLLDLYAAELGHRRVSVSSLCVASNVPATTALRWMNMLESRGLIARNPDISDGRRYFVALTRKARCALDSYFAARKPDRLPV